MPLHLQAQTEGLDALRETATATVRPKARSGHELLKASKEFAREQRGRSWWCLWSTVAVVAGCVTLTALPLIWPLRIVASCVAALSLVRLFIIYHDHNHGTILRSSKLADWVMLIYGILTMNPPSTWKRSHNHHHKNNAKLFGANIGSFPVMTTDGYANASRRQRLYYRLSRNPVTILLGYWTVFFYGMCLKPLLMEPRRHIDCLIAVATQIAIITSLAVFAPWALLYSFVLPIAIAAGLGAYLFYSQHNFPGVKLRGRTDWDFVYAAIHSSSYTAMGPILAWFTGNIGYHHIHHLNAHIPFYRLPEAMARITELQAVRPIRLTLMDMYRCFRLKLWDTSKNRMVSYRGV